MNKSTGIRLTGTRKQIQKTLERLESVMELYCNTVYVEGTRQPLEWLAERDDCTEGFLYLRGYVYDAEENRDYPSPSRYLVGIIEAQRNELQQQAEIIGRLEEEVERLREQLGTLPQPKATDAVLGTGNRSYLKITNLHG